MSDIDVVIDVGLAVDVVVDATEVLVVEVLEQGPPGVKGDQGERGEQGPPVTFKYLAGHTISGHRVVALNQFGQLVYASADEVASGVRAIGLTTAAALVGEEVVVQKFGALIEPSWNWTPESPIYLGLTGLLTQQTPEQPSSHFSMVIGFAIDSTSIFIDMKTPIILSE